VLGGPDGNATVERVLRGSRRTTPDPSDLRCGCTVSTRRVALGEGTRAEDDDGTVAGHAEQVRVSVHAGLGAARDGAR
jgi:hypothetical protein